MEEGDGRGNPGMEGLAEASEGFGNGWGGGERVVVGGKHGFRGEESGGAGRGHLRWRGVVWL